MEIVNRSLTQKQFNEHVKENIDELGMDEDDAVELAVEQLVSQEVSLADIIPDVWVVKREDPISVFCDKYNQIPLANAIGNGFDVSECLERMKCATEMANKRWNYKLYAVDCMMDVIILSLAKMTNADEKIIRACLECLIQLYTGHPDPLKEETVDWLLGMYEKSDGAIQFLVLDLLKEGCTAHEHNKRMLFSKTDLIDKLRAIIDSESLELLTPALGLLGNLSKDDDVKVQTSEAHERAVRLAECSLCKVYDMVKHPQLSEMKVLLLETLASLTVTDHLALEVFCHDDELSVMEDLLNGTAEDENIMVSLIKFLVALCGHDKPKTAMGLLIPLIINKIKYFQECQPVMKTAFHFMSVLASENKHNSMTLIACDAVDIVLQGMKAHQESVIVQQNGCLALKNMASSSKCLQPFYKLGVPEFITELMANDSSNTLMEVCKSVNESLGAPHELDDWPGSEHSKTLNSC